MIAKKKSAPSSKSAFDRILCTDQKSLQKISIKVWLTLFKYGNAENSKTNESNNLSIC